MILSAVTTRVNKLVGKGNHAFADVVPYLDEAVDRINSDLSMELPVFSDVYANTFTKNDSEADLTYAANSLDNNYTRISDAYIRNYVAYYAALKMLQEEDEAPEVYLLRQQHAELWYQKLVAVHADTKLEDSEAIICGDDVDEVEEEDAEDDTALGYYNPYFDEEA